MARTSFFSPRRSLRPARPDGMPPTGRTGLFHSCSRNSASNRRTSSRSHGARGGGGTQVTTYARRVPAGNGAERRARWRRGRRLNLRSPAHQRAAKRRARYPGGSGPMRRAGWYKARRRRCLVLRARVSETFLVGPRRRRRLARPPTAGLLARRGPHSTLSFSLRASSSSPVVIRRETVPFVVLS